LELSPLLQAASPTTRQMLMINRFTPVRLCIHEHYVAQSYTWLRALDSRPYQWWN
jgi:hypothetical protein